MRPYLLPFLSAVALACGPTPANLDAGPPPVDAGPTAPTDGDAGLPDAGPSVSPDGGSPEPDGGASGEVMVDPACSYEPVDNFVMWCSARWTTFHHLEPMPRQPACPTLIASGARAFSSFGAAAGAFGCDTACVYIEFQAAQFVYCRARAEYITLKPGGEGQTGPSSACGPLMHYESVAGGGFYTSGEAFTSAHPCP